ncbi:sialidase family protein [Nonomuraea fuscirosea]|uniref:sialidase family protein n=1 Tax=Nonomuraea fuscirosea TaxID=1291556 RepID=UPI0033D8359D
MPAPARRRGIGGLVPVITVPVITVVVTTVAVLIAALSAVPVPVLAEDAGGVPLTELGADTGDDSEGAGQRGTQAGSDTYQWGSTIVAAQQSGRFHDAGASGIAFATSADNGATWARGLLPGLTAAGGGPYARVSDPSVAFDARHGVWLIASLALSDAGGLTGAAVLTSRSADGLTWDRPVTTAVAGGGDLDKPWIVCDNGAASPFRGRCHVLYDDHADGNAIHLARSADGGLTWEVTGTSATGIGGQPVVRPNGAVVVPYLGNDGRIRSVRSRDGGASWEESVLVAEAQRHAVAGGLRAAPLPSAETDADGAVYVAWHDCRFQTDCGGNDIVLSRSATGATWSEPARVTADGGDHFIPGLGVDRESTGDQARLALVYYRYPEALCTAATCRLTVAYTSSSNGGASWSPPLELAGPMSPGWLAATADGRTAGDYLSISVVPGGSAFPAFAVAAAPAGGTLDVRTHTVTGGLPIMSGEPPTVARAAAIASGDPHPALPPTAR